MANTTASDGRKRRRVDRVIDMRKERIVNNSALQPIYVPIAYIAFISIIAIFHRAHTKGKQDETDDSAICIYTILPCSTYRMDSPYECEQI